MRFIMTSVDRTLSPFTLQRDSDILRLVKIASDCYEVGDLGDAASICRIALRFLPANYDAMRILGNIYLSDGRLVESLIMHENAFHINPNDPYVCFGIANILYTMENYDKSISYFNYAIINKHDYAEAYCDRGAVFARINRHDEALQDYERAIMINPQLAEAHSNRGTSLGHLKRYEEALDSFGLAIAVRPEISAFHRNLGVMLASLNRHKDALVSYERLATLDPNNATIHYNIANSLVNLQHYEEALLSFDRSIALNPHFVEAHTNRGLVLITLNRYADALASYEHAITLRPDVAELYFNRGAALGKLRRDAEALQSYDQAIALKFNFPEAQCNRGLTLIDLDRNEDAISSLDLAIEMNQNSAELYSNRGVALAKIKKHHEALINYDKSIRLKPDIHSAHWNKSRSLLALGEYSLGWHYFEWRKHPKKPFCQMSSTETIEISKMENNEILVYWEEGLGDTIQFCRYVPMLAEICASVCFSVPVELRDLFALSFPNVSIVEDRQISDQFDISCALMSLPLAFGTTLDNIPGHDPYLFASDEKRDTFARRLGVKTRPRVGLVWNGGFRPEQPEVWAVNQRRNIDFSLISELNISSIDFFSLQKGEPAESALSAQQHRYWNGNNFYNFASDLENFSDTAGLISNLDLVISVDTSTAHLAAAMGKPVWIMNRFDSCWRWLTGRTDSPWYPTVRLFNQAEPGAWAPVISQIRHELGQYFSAGITVSSTKAPRVSR